MGGESTYRNGERPALLSASLNNWCIIQYTFAQITHQGWYGIKQKKKNKKKKQKQNLAWLISLVQIGIHC